MSTQPVRCPWPGDDPKMIHYHDTEWGVPVYDDLKIFEFFVLDAFQAGLSWRTVLHKRENFKKAFSEFDFEKIALYTDQDVARLMADAGIIRNKMKIEATIHNAKLVAEMHKRKERFSDLLWNMVGGSTIQNRLEFNSQVPARTEVSDRMSKELKKLGFKFVGSTICYAFMQAAGMVNDHLETCYRHKSLR